MDIEQIILRNLQYNEDFARKVFPFFKEDYFSSASKKIYFHQLQKYFEKYNKFPSHDEIYVDITTSKIPETYFDDVLKLALSTKDAKDEKVDSKWLLDTSERFCKDRALYLALQESISITQGNVKNLSTTAIPEILSKALSITFDSKLGHDYFDDVESRYDYYTTQTSKIPFHLETFNRVTNGGVERKTLNCAMASTGGGKSLLMCDFAANYALQGYNVLYITLEMAEEKISQRIDANLLNISMSEFKSLKNSISKTEFADKVSKLKTSTTGRIKIKEYPNFGAHVGNFRYLLREYKTKHNFIPDILIVDYMNICSSVRHKNGGVNSYEYVKSVCEELRGLAVEYNLCVWTCTQANRSSYNSSEMGIENTSDSLGGPMTFDYFIGLIATPDLIKIGQILITQLKSRYEEIQKCPKFILGLDRSKMKFYDLNASPAPSINNSSVNNLNFKGVKV
jgi:hypothetical protein